MNDRSRLAALIALALSTPAWSQADPSSDEEDARSESATSSSSESSVELQTVEVTGTLISSSLQETPDSVQVWQGRTMQDAGMTELEDVYEQTANVFQVDNGEGFGIRGIRHNSLGTGGGGELASYYVDGVALTGFSKRFGPMELYDVEQIEILRGPQTTNVGRNALAGAIVMETRDPVFANEASVRLGAGTYASYDAAAMFNVATGDDHAFRFVAQHRQTDGFVENPTRDEDDFDAREVNILRGKWLFEPGADDRLRGVLSLQYSETERGNDTVDLAEPEERLNFSNLDDFEENESLIASLDLSYAIDSRWSIRSITSYIDADYLRFDDDDQSAGGGGSFRGRNAVDRNWAQDLRLEFDSGAGVRGVIGAYYTDVELENNTVGEVNLEPALLGVPEPLLPFYPSPIIVGIDFPGVFETTNKALFTHWDWQVNETWSLFAGLRYDNETQESDSVQTSFLVTPLPDPNTPGLPPPVAGGITQVNAVLESQLGTSTSITDTDYDAFLPEFGVTRTFGEHLDASLFYKRGYRAGGAEINLVGRFFTFDPEYLDTVELALRSEWLDRRLTLNGNVYVGRWEDQQVSVQITDNVLDTVVENAGESEIAGFELESRYRISSLWDIYGSLGFAHTEFRDFESAAQGDLQGNRFLNAPEWTAAVGSTYRFGRGWFVHGNASYQGTSFADVENATKLDPRLLLNARVGYETVDWAVYLWGSNLLDDVYRVTDNPFFDRRIGKVGAPRQFGAQLELFF